LNSSLNNVLETDDLWKSTWSELAPTPDCWFVFITQLNIIMSEYRE
jgi:hypothetical protein